MTGHRICASVSFGFRVSVYLCVFELYTLLGLKPPEGELIKDQQVFCPFFSPPKIQTLQMFPLMSKTVDVYISQCDIIPPTAGNSWHLFRSVWTV